MVLGSHMYHTQLKLSPGCSRNRSPHSKLCPRPLYSYPFSYKSSLSGSPTSWNGKGSISQHPTKVPDSSHPSSTTKKRNRYVQPDSQLLGSYGELGWSLQAWFFRAWATTRTWKSMSKVKDEVVEGRRWDPSDT